jgi:hypothetical protein
MPVKPINWFDNLPCLGMENQPTNRSQEMPVKPIILPQSINMMKVDHQSHDDKKECNAVADKGLFKSTNWFLDSGANGHFCHNTDYFIQYERIDENAFTAYDNNKLPIIGKGTVKITIVGPRNRHITFYVTNVNHSPAVRLNILLSYALNN